MDLIQTLSELRQEKRQLDEAILVLEKIAAGQPRGKGRPPKWMTVPKDGQDGTPKRVLSAESRAKMAEAQRRRWAAQRESSSDSPK